MSRHDAMQLDGSLDAGDISRASLVWSGAADAPLADAHRFAGYPFPTGGLVLWRGSALFRVVRLGGHKVRKARSKYGETSFSPCWVFLFSRTRCWGLILWHLWIARARHPSRYFGTEVLNVGRGLTHGDLALEAGVDFLAVVEHRLIQLGSGVSGPGLGRRVWPLFGPCQPRFLPCW